MSESLSFLPCDVGRCCRPPPVPPAGSQARHWAPETGHFPERPTLSRDTCVILNLNQKTSVPVLDDFI